MQKKRTYPRERRRVAKRIRGITPRGERQPCCVCGNHQGITEQHHLIPVSEMTETVIAHDLYGVPLHLPCVWLCPNCHAYYHAMKKNSRLPLEKLAQANREMGITMEMLEAFVEMDKGISIKRLREMFEQAYQKRTAPKQPS